MENQIKDLEGSQTQAQQEQAKLSADMDVVIDERNKYSQIVADLQIQTVSKDYKVIGGCGRLGLLSIYLKVM